MKKIKTLLCGLAIGSTGLFGSGCSSETPRTVTRETYAENIDDVMLGMMMSGLYSKVAFTGEDGNGRRVITATLK